MHHASGGNLTPNMHFCRKSDFVANTCVLTDTAATLELEKSRRIDFSLGRWSTRGKKNALYLGIAQIAIGPPCTQPGILGPGRSGTLEPIWEKSQNHLQTGARCLVHISHGCHSHIASGSGCRVGCTKISKSFRNSYLTWYMLYLYERRPKMQKKWFLGHFPRLATIL